MNKDNINKLLAIKLEGKRNKPTPRFVLKLILAGMSIDDILSLKVSDIDFANGKLKDINLTPDLIASLGHHLGFSKSRLSTGMLFTGAYQGKISPMSKDNLAKTLHNLCKDVGLTLADLDIGLEKPSKDIGSKRLLTTGKLEDIQKWMELVGVIGGTAAKETAATQQKKAPAK